MRLTSGIFAYMFRVLLHFQFAALVKRPGPTAIGSAGGLDCNISNSAILAVSLVESGTLARWG